MRQLLVPTCLFLTAWSSATGSSVINRQTEGFSVISKTVQAAAVTNNPVSETPLPEITGSVTVQPVVPAPPAETTAQILVSSNEQSEPAEIDHPVLPVSKAPLRRAVSKDEVCDALASAASNYDLPAPFFIRLIYQESGFNSQAVSRAGAQGVAQFMPAVASRMGLDDPFDPLKALHKSAQLLRTLFKQFGNFGLAAAAYNAGPKRIQDWLDKKGKLPDETRNYVQTITGRPAEHWVSQKTVAAAQRVPARAPCQREAGLLAANGPKKIPLPPSRGADKIEFASLDHKPVVITASAKKTPAEKSSLKTAVVAVKSAAKSAVKVAKATTDKATKAVAKATGKAPAKVRVADASRSAK